MFNNNNNSIRQQKLKTYKLNPLDYFVDYGNWSNDYLETKSDDVKYVPTFPSFSNKKSTTTVVDKNIIIAPNDNNYLNKNDITK
ncbi:hypothetical protein ABK040_007950 [Willaertia magna]